jgi:hypothetical protein
MIIEMYKIIDGLNKVHIIPRNPEQLYLRIEDLYDENRKEHIFNNRVFFLEDFCKDHGFELESIEIDIELNSNDWNASK